MKISPGPLWPVFSSFLLFGSHTSAQPADPRVVTNSADSGPGSLRESLALAAATPGAETITFAANLSGQSLVLLSQLTIHDIDGVTVDASALPAGLLVTDAGDVNHRLLSVSGGVATLRCLTLANGGGNSFAANSGTGGAVLTNGSLTLDRCTFSGNTAASGAALFSATSPDLSTTQTQINRCTFSGNTATLRGGAITNDAGRTTLLHCTISGNSAPIGSGSGISSTGNLTTETVVRYSLIAQNTNSSVDIASGAVNSFTSQGYNLIGPGNATGDFNQAGDQINPSTLNLGPLANYGGPSPTIALKPLSMARNAALGSTITSDQRGFPIIGAPDIGAYEAGSTGNFNAWISETLPPSATAPQYAASFDFDGDGQSNALEYATLGNPTVPSGGQNLALTRNAGGTQATLVVPYRFNAQGLSYVIERSTTLGAWLRIATIDSGSNLFFPTAGVNLSANTSVSLSFTDTFIEGKPRVFYRLNARVNGF
jgi:hypothetical protein